MGNDDYETRKRRCSFAPVNLHRESAYYFRKYQSSCVECVANLRSKEKMLREQTQTRERAGRGNANFHLRQVFITFGAC